VRDEVLDKSTKDYLARIAVRAKAARVQELELMLSHQEGRRPPSINMEDAVGLGRLQRQILLAHRSKV
jgi:hypothetical protein